MSRTTAKRGRSQDSSDDDSAGDSEPREVDVSWEPEEGAVFNVPMTEFYDDVSDIPEDILVPGDWKTQERRGVFKEKIKNRGRGGDWKYGILFDGDTKPSFYDNIYDWEEYCAGVDLSESDDSDDAVDPNAEVYTARRTGPVRPTVSDGDSEDDEAVILEHDDEELDEEQDDDDLGEDPPELDDDTPMDAKLEKLEWKDDGDITTDARASHNAPENFVPALALHDKETCSLLGWWFKWFPKPLLIKIVAAINAKAGKIKWPKGASRQWKKLTNGEFLRWVGMWLLMGVYPISPRRDYWRGKMGFRKYMSENRFEQILRAFALPTWQRNHEKWGGAAGNKMKHDRFLHCRRYLDDVKAAWIKAITPGGWLCLDESMTAWLGLTILMPGWKVIKRKPHPFGLEFKTVCCAVTGVMINMEPQEGKDIMKWHPYVKEVNKSSAWCLRLCSPWFWSKRTLVADAAFGQVRAVVALMEKGLYMLCNVKQCHKFFPKAVLKEQTPPFRSNNQCTTLTLQAKYTLSTGEEVKMQACGWRATNNMVVTYLGSCGLTTPGVARAKKRYQLLKNGNHKTIKYKVQRPGMGSEYQGKMGAVDGWNYQKHQFKIPPTTDPMFRIFSDFSIIGTSINVYKALKHFCPERLVDQKATSDEVINDKGQMNHHQFCEVMAMSLIQNQWIIQDGQSEPQQGGEEGGREHKAHPDGTRHRRKCIGCNTQTHLICTGCSAPGKEKTIQCQGKTHKLKPGFKFFCKKCFPSHVCGEAKHTRKSVSRPGVAESNRERAGTDSDSDSSSDSN